MASSAHHGAAPDYTRRYFLQAVTQPGPIGAIQAAPSWTEEFQDWAGTKDQDRPRQLEPSEGWSWIKPGQAEGRLVGGCLARIDSDQKSFSILEPAVI